MKAIGRTGIKERKKTNTVLRVIFLLINLFLDLRTLHNFITLGAILSATRLWTCYFRVLA